MQSRFWLRRSQYVFYLSAVSHSKFCATKTFAAMILLYHVCCKGLNYVRNYFRNSSWVSLRKFREVFLQRFLQRLHQDFLQIFLHIFPQKNYSSNFNTDSFKNFFQIYFIRISARDSLEISQEIFTEAYFDGCQGIYKEIPTDIQSQFAP